NLYRVAEASKTTGPILTRVKQSEADAGAEPYYILDVLTSTTGKFSLSDYKDTASGVDYRLAVGFYVNPLRTENKARYSNGFVCDSGVVLRPDHVSHRCPSGLTSDYCLVYWSDATNPEQWYWKLGVIAPAPNSPAPKVTPPLYTMGQLLPLAGAAEYVVPI